MYIVLNKESINFKNNEKNIQGLTKSVIAALVSFKRKLSHCLTKARVWAMPPAKPQQPGHSSSLIRVLES